MRLHILHLHILLGHWYDREVSATEIDDEAVARHWRDLSADFFRIAAALDRALSSKHDLTATEFDVLERLAGAEKGELRLAELAGQVYLSQSALSRLVTRLESDGLVGRHACDTDRRSVFAQITEKGRSTYEAARPTQRETLRATSAGCDVGTYLCDGAG